MSAPVLDLRTDGHTHTARTDGADPVDVMALAAQAAGLATLCVTDHVRADTAWLPQYVEELERARRSSPVDIVCGVEAKILDVRGRVDLPGDLRGVDLVVVSDHQVPTRSGPVHPEEIRRRVATGALTATDVVDDLVLATCRAVSVHERVVLGHLFSILPKAGIAPDTVHDEHLRLLAAACREADAAVEVNEKWRTPTVETSRRLVTLGVRLVASSDAHEAAAVGRWDHVAATAAALGD